MEKQPTIKEVLSQPAHFFAFGFGSGLSPIAPGTIGTLVGIPIYLLLSSLELYLYIFALIIISIVGIITAGRSARLLETHDHGGIVIDEICGYLVTMLFAPSGWVWILLGFVLFRVFDIFKPWPISWLDRDIGGGLGIVADDLMAGIYALLSLQLVVLAVS